ncbi:XRE family transcriptional regulator, partial [Streptococcus sp. DD11]
MARGRGASSPQDKEAMLQISKTLKDLLKEQGKKQVELSRETGIPASTITGYIKGSSLPVAANLKKIAAFFGVAVEDIDPRYRLIADIPQQFPELNRIYQQLSQDQQEEVLKLAEKKVQEKEQKEGFKDSYFPYLVYENYYISQHKKEQADLVWLDREIDYDIALWVRTDSLEPKSPRGSVALIKETHFELAGAIYAIDYDGQTIIKKVFNDPAGIRLISLNKKYSDKFIPHE